MSDRIQARSASDATIQDILFQFERHCGQLLLRFGEYAWPFLQPCLMTYVFMYVVAPNLHPLIGLRRNSYLGRIERYDDKANVPHPDFLESLRQFQTRNYNRKGASLYCLEFNFDLIGVISDISDATSRVIRLNLRHIERRAPWVIVNSFFA